MSLAGTVSAPSLSRVLVVAMLAGILAGLGTAMFHAIVTEPVIEQAIVLEEMKARTTPGAALSPALSPPPAEQPHNAPVSREAQRVGLWPGWLGLGVGWGGLIGSAYFLAARHLGGFASRAPRVLMGLAAWWTLALMPALKYPANPPGVGDPETIGLRLRYFAGLELLTGLVIAVAIIIALQLRGRLGQWRGVRWSWALGAAIVLAASLAMYLALPANPDEAGVPAALLATFRRDSRIGLTLFWLLFTAAFVALPLARRFRFAPVQADAASVAPRVA